MIVLVHVGVVGAGGGRGRRGDGLGGGPAVVVVVVAAAAAAHRHAGRVAQAGGRGGAAVLGRGRGFVVVAGRLVAAALTAGGSEAVRRRGRRIVGWVSSASVGWLVVSASPSSRRGAAGVSDEASSDGTGERNCLASLFQGFGALPPRGFLGLSQDGCHVHVGILGEEAAQFLGDFCKG